MPPGTIGNSGFDISSSPRLFGSPNDLLKTVSIIPLFSGFAESLTHGLPHPCALGDCAGIFAVRKNISLWTAGKSIRSRPFCRVHALRREFAPSKKLAPAYARAFPHSMIWSPERPRKASEPQFRKEIKPHLLDDFSRRALTSAML